jgi:WD40 repeat protein
MNSNLPPHPKFNLDGSGDVWLNFGEYGGEVELACFSPCGTRLLTVKEVEVARIWDVGSGKHVGEIKPHSPLEGQRGVGPTASPFKVFIESAALDSKGEHALLGLNDGTAGVFRVSDGARLSVLHEPDPQPGAGWSLVRAVAFSPDGTLAAVGFRRRTAAVWSSREGALRGVFRSPRANQPYDPKDGPRPGLVSSIGISADNHYLFGGYADLTGTIWYLQTGRVWHDWEDHQDNNRIPNRRLAQQIRPAAGAFLWNGPGTRFVHVGDGPRGWATPLSLSDDERLTLVPAANSLALIDLSDDQRVLSLMPFEGRLRATRIAAEYALAVNSAGKVHRWALK